MSRLDRDAGHDLQLELEGRCPACASLDYIKDLEAEEHRARKAARTRDRRAAETPEQRERRLAWQRDYYHRTKGLETPEARERRLARVRDYTRRKRREAGIPPRRRVRG